jgi:hypothetical protein
MTVPLLAVFDSDEYAIPIAHPAIEIRPTSAVVSIRVCSPISSIFGPAF